MTITHPRITFGLYDLEYKADSTLACPDQQPHSKLADLKNGSASPRAYASYEPDYWLLDGQYKFLPETPYTTVHAGLVSLSMSGADGAFAVPPVLTVTFSETHDTESLALTFAPTSGDYCDDLTIACYAGASLIRSDSYAPTVPEFSTGQAVTGFDKIVITFNSTSRPYRYLRLMSLDYGDTIVFDGAAILSARLVEEVNQISAELPYSQLDLELYSAEAGFSILNPSGDYARLGERQPLDVYEEVDGARLHMGRFYLDEWSNKSDTQYKFRAVDILSILDRLPYRGGMFAAAALDTVLEAMLGAVGVPYELDNLLAGQTLTGWLPMCSYRQALQQIGFVVGASITATRGGVLRIYATKLSSGASEATITRAQKGQEQNVELSPLVTAVEVTAHDYAPSGEVQVLTSGIYAAGVYEIAFGMPVHTVIAEGATVLESGANYCRISVPAAGQVIVSGLVYAVTTTTYTLTAPGVRSTTTPNVMQVQTATLVHSGNVAAVAARVYAYTGQRHVQSLRLFAPTLEPGAVVTIDTLYGSQIRAVIDRMESDLAKGFIVKAKATGSPL